MKFSELRKKERTFSGTTSMEESLREKENRKVAYEAACEGIVLLKNEGILPLDRCEPVVLVGGGAGRTIKGGTGSGDVCERRSISVYEGMKEAGFTIVSEDWIRDYEKTYTDARLAWKEKILTEAGGAATAEFFNAYASNQFEMPSGRAITAEDLSDAKTAIYVISRISGEGKDRKDAKGDYDLTDAEKEHLQYLNASVENLIVLLNTGGPMDVKEILKLDHVQAIVYISQGGMEGGKAVADVLCGTVTPSGKLTATWAVDYSDYPNAETFSYHDGSVTKEIYGEGIYVGYRYFDSFHVAPQYAFGYGLSYTDFSIETKEVTAEENQVVLSLEVKNTGAVYSGKEVVQVYVSCPQGRLDKEEKRLAAFAKTDLLKPGESQQLTITLTPDLMESYDEESLSWILEKGEYRLYVGNSSDNISPAAVLALDHEVVLEKTHEICPLKEELTELTRIDCSAEKADNVPVLAFEAAPVEKKRLPDSPYAEAAAELVELLTDEELAVMAVGELSKNHDVQLGAAGIMVPGAAGETASILEEKYGVPGVPMADGPAGVRIMKEYQADVEAKEVYTQGFLGALENGFFVEKSLFEKENTTTFYQFCTAFPIGTMLAQTWNTELIRKTGHAAGVEMDEFGIAWWLAPGMNIMRNPLCGRNFEYYSEDPLVAGKMAAAMTDGVQSVPGAGTTIKHFACNNQEDNRMGSDSIVSPRALREIYLKGFEIAVKKSQPMSIMTSYNLINGTHSANSRDLCTTLVRDEWDFKGFIMTDWTTTSSYGGSLAWKCMQAGNDLIMPGIQNDTDNILAALKDGSLDREELKLCIRRLLTVIFQTNAYERLK